MNSRLCRFRHPVLTHVQSITTNKKKKSLYPPSAILTTAAGPSPKILDGITDAARCSQHPQNTVNFFQPFFGAGPREPGWKVAIGTDKVQLEGSVETGQVEDEIDLEFRTRSDGVQYRMEYEREAGDTETEYDIRFRCYALVEYIPAASTSALNVSTSTVVKTVLFNDNWSHFVGVTTSDPMTFTTTWTGSAGLTVLARFHVAKVKLTDANNIILTPNGVKVDFEVHNFPYQDRTNQSQLPLVCTTASSVEIDTDDDDDDDDNEYNSFQFYTTKEAAVKVGLDWVPTDEADESTVAVHSSDLVALSASDRDLDEELDDDKEYRIYYSFTAKQPKHIVWDPQTAV
eukprot:g1859.t1